MTTPRLLRSAAVLSLIGCALTVQAGTISVGQGSALDLGSAVINAPTSSVTNHGVIRLGSATSTVSGFSNMTTGSAFGESAQLQLLEDWSNQGVFDPGASVVRFVDGGSGTSRILGTSSFHELAAVSASGNTLVFEAGRLQTVTGHLELLGAPGNRLNIVSTSPGAQAFLALQAEASQQVQFVNVSDNHGTAQVIAPGPPAASGSVQGLNVRGWFSTPLEFAIPTLSATGLFLLSLLMLLAMAHTQRSRRNTE